METLVRIEKQVDGGEVVIFKFLSEDDPETYSEYDGIDDAGVYNFKTESGFNQSLHKMCETADFTVEHLKQYITLVRPRQN
jgi:hypothetical protein